MEETISLTVQIERAAKERLDRLARETGRSRSVLAGQAISAFLDIDEWQVEGIKAGLASLDRGAGIEQEDVERWVASWDTEDELPMPDSA